MGYTKYSGGWCWAVSTRATGAWLMRWCPNGDEQTASSTLGCLKWLFHTWLCPCFPCTPLLLATLTSCCCLYHDAAAQPAGWLFQLNTRAFLNPTLARARAAWQGQPEDYAWDFSSLLFLRLGSNYLVSLPHSFEKNADEYMNKWFSRASGLILLHDFTGFWSQRFIPVSKRKEW